MKIKPVFLVLPILAQTFSQQVNTPYSINDQQSIVSPSVIVSATIGAPKMTLWGYGPANSIMELSGVGVSEQTASNSTGYYYFGDILLPVPTPSADYQPTTFTEVCVTAVDPEKRITPPTCIPPIPFGKYFFNIGPVILPPTLSIDNGAANSGAQVAAQGETIPNSDIDIVLAKAGGTSFLGLGSFKFVGEVYADYLPTYKVRSDASGSFSFNLPTTETNTWRVFAITNYASTAPSPKSNTLKFQVLPLYVSFWETLMKFLSSLLVWPRILILEALLIVILLIIILTGKRKKINSRKHSQPVYYNQTPSSWS